jgi:hypothetical protein
MLDPLIPSAPSSASPTTRETHLAKKCLPMRLPISPRRLNPLKKSGLKPHDYEFHIPERDAIVLALMITTMENTINLNYQ